MSFLKFIFEDGGYTAYVLVILVLAYLTIQYARYIYTVAQIPFIDYNSFQYAFIAGPLFTVVYTTSGLFISYYSKAHLRLRHLVTIMLLSGGMVTLVSVSTDFWHIALLRAGLAFSESGFIPFSTSLLGEYFPSNFRATSLGIYNIGIYAGIGCAQGIGTLVATTLGWRWEYILAGLMPASVGLLILLTVKSKSCVSTKVYPSKSDFKKLLQHWCSRPSLPLLCLAAGIRTGGGHCWNSFSTIFFSDLFTFMPTQTEVCIYSYSQDYFAPQICNKYFPYCIGGKCKTLSKNPWHNVGISPVKFESFILFIPAIAGSVGAILGGVFSDGVSRGEFPAQLFVVILSIVLAVPFAVGVLLAPYPWCFLCLIGVYLFGEMYTGVVMNMIIELSPSSKHLSVTSIALYLFIITNIGGSSPLLVPLVKQVFDKMYVYHFYASVLIGESITGVSAETSFTITQMGAEGLQQALLWLFPGLYALSSFLFCVAFCLLRRDLVKSHEEDDICDLQEPLLCTSEPKAADQT